jgi:TonB-linked SusC/RagA family outer membrane protein
MSKPIFLTCLLWGMLMGTSARSQQITLDRDNASLRELFLAIHQQTGYFFYYSNGDLARAKPVSLHVSKASLDHVLALCFEGQPLTYQMNDHTIVVRKKTNTAKGETGNLEILGRVTDSLDRPVAGATVTAEPSINMAADELGYFQLHNVDSGTLLRFSSVGFENAEVLIENSRTLMIRLKPAVGNLDEVEVIAYGETTKRFGTGSVGTLPARVISQQPVSNPLAALVGEIPGLVITQKTGVPGGSFDVQIRGQNSLANGTTPLYIIDGVPYPPAPLGFLTINSAITRGGDPLSSLNPLDIESISVLKDADATAIYGSRGANGVILITTKKGRAGKAKLEINAYTGWQQVPRKLPVLNTPQYLIMRREAFQNDGAEPVPGLDVDLLNWDSARNSSWPDRLIGNVARTSDGQLTLSGGSELTQFILSGNIHRETTVFPGNYEDRKLSGHFGLTHHSADQKLSLSLLTGYSIVHDYLPTVDITQTANNLPPNAPEIFLPSGQLNWADGNFQNPFGVFQTVYGQQTGNLTSDLNLGYRLARPLQFRLNAGYNNVSVREYAGYPTTAFNPTYNVTTATAFFSDSRLESWILEPQLEYKPRVRFGQLTVLAGASVNQQDYHQQNLSATGISSNNLLENIDAAARINTRGSQQTLYQYAGIFSRVNYQYKEKYLLSLTARRDGSSRFGPGKQFADFGAIGAGWIFSYDSAIHAFLPGLSFGKLRGSYGSAGNDQIGDYQYLDTWRPTYYPYLQNNTLVPTRLFSPDYSWEITRKLEAALELGFLNNRILLTVEYYRNRSSNQLIAYSLPLLTGFSSVQKNMPATIQNAGLELEMNTVNIRGGIFSWNTGISLTIPHNELIGFPGLASSPYANFFQIGKPLSMAKTFHAVGVSSATGLQSYEDVNKDGQITYPDDLASVISLQPKYFGGVRNHLQYRGWSLDFFFYFIKQTGSNYLSGNYTSPGMAANQPVWVLNRWQKPGDQRPIQQFTQDYASPAYGAYSNLSLSDQAYSDASFIRLKNLSFSYQFPESWIKSLHLSAVRIYFLGQNLITITHYQGMDPESKNIQALPALRVLTTGIQLTL